MNTKKYDYTLTSLDMAVIKQLGGECRNTADGCEISEDAAQELENVTRCSCGAAGGFSGFIYYTETREFFAAHRDEIAKRIADQIDNGLFDGAITIMDAVRMFNCLKGEDATTIETEAARAFFGPLEDVAGGELDLVANACAWGALEDLAFSLDGCEIED